MRIIENPARSEWEALTRRQGVDYEGIRPRVEAILDAVEKEGDAALKRLMLEIDKVDAPLEVTDSEVDAACAKVSQAVREAILTAKRNIEAFHSAQLPREIRVETAPGVVCIQRPVPIRRVGLYIPGGSATLFSTVLMLAVPAALAGCRERILCTPCRKDGSVAPEVLLAARECGITRIFRIGGAQAVAAMAFGTESVPKVDKIFGPGNPYVTLAKQLVSGRNTSIDMPAGPSEVMVLPTGARRPPSPRPTSSPRRSTERTARPSSSAPKGIMPIRYCKKLRTKRKRVLATRRSMVPWRTVLPSFSRPSGRSSTLPRNMHRST